jgi:hypothetical protein
MAVLPVYFEAVPLLFCIGQKRGFEKPHSSTGMKILVYLMQE